MELTVQHADFSFEELGEFEAAEVRRRIVERNWEAGRKAYIARMAEQGHACPPSLYASKHDDYCLHVYATREGFEAAVLIPRAKKLWGIFPLSSTSSVIRIADSLDELLPVVDAYLENDAEAMIELFDRELV